MNIYVKCSSTDVRNCLTDSTVGVRKGSLTLHQMPLGRIEAAGVMQQKVRAAVAAFKACG